MIACGGVLPRGGQPLPRPLPAPGSRRRRHAHHRHGQHRKPRQHTAAGSPRMGCSGSRRVIGPQPEKHAHPPLWAALERKGLFSVAAHERRFCARRLMLYGAPANMARLLSRWCSARAGLPIRRHGDFSGIGHFDLPALPCLAMRGLPCRTGALDRLALVTQVPRSLQHRRRSTRQLRRTRQRPAANR
jgi:hypothetical protein